jgi:hypothetical protein
LATKEISAMDHKSEAFALSGFMLTVNLMRLLAFKGVITPSEALATVDEARQQLRALGATNQAARADMLDRELLDYEALFQEVDDRAAQDLMANLAQSLERILDADQQASEQDDIQEAILDPDIPEPWQPDGWGLDTPAKPPRWEEDDAGPEPAIEIAEYQDEDEEPANQR